MRQRMLSIGDDYWIENADGERAYKVDGKALRLRKTLVLEDAHGHALAKIQERVARLRDSMEVEDATGTGWRWSRRHWSPRCGTGGSWT